MMLRTALCVALLPGLALAQDDTETNPRVTEILDRARAECIADVAGDPTAPKPDLVLKPGALNWVDLDGEDERNDTIVDFNYIYCSLNYSLWHGSGGSIIHLVVNGETSTSWSGGIWRVVDFYQSPLVLIGKHGTWCDGYGAQPCVQAISVHEGGFSTVMDGRSLEQDAEDEEMQVKKP